MKRNNLLALVVLGTMVVFTLGLLVNSGALAKEKIRIGGIVDLTGPTNVIGVPYSNGIEDYFAMVNKEGGINGRQIDYFPIDF
ncbi:ABC transporter substrate-binding protein, partial [bacterium]|nr:ABC transporter substrate-binding protein [bacterium]